MTNSRVGFTKIGFSKAGFACCSHYTFCDMGKSSCFYADADPEAKEYCAAYIRNHSTIAAPDVSIVDVPINLPPAEKVNQSESDILANEKSGGQLSLF